MKKYMTQKVTPLALVEEDSKEEEDSNEYVLYFDGCSKGNPGLGGAGAVLYENNEEIWGSSKLVGEKVTNNVAEYSGLIIGLQEAFIRKIKKIIVRGDSQLVIRQMKGEYKVNSKSLENYYTEAKILEKYFDNIIFQHVYRDKNKRADELSNMALEVLL
jgi:ribonuclease HI